MEAMVIAKGQRDGDPEDPHLEIEAAAGMWEDTRAMVVGVADLPDVVSGAGFYLAEEVSTNLCYGHTTMRQIRLMLSSLATV